MRPILGRPLKTDAAQIANDCGRPEKNRRGRGAKELQQPVFGIYQRQDGLVYVKPVAEVDKPTLQDIIKNKVSIETTIYSDTWKSYQGWGKSLPATRP